MDATSGGRLIVRRFDLRLNTSSASSLPSVPPGIGPNSPIAGSRTSRTRLPLGVQVIPTQDVHNWVVEVQLSFRPWGSDAANARRACLSEFRSAPLAQGMCVKKRAAERIAISLRCHIVRNGWKKKGNCSYNPRVSISASLLPHERVTRVNNTWIAIRIFRIKRTVQKFSLQVEKKVERQGNLYRKNNTLHFSQRTLICLFYRDVCMVLTKRAATENICFERSWRKKEEQLFSSMINIWRKHINQQI